MAEYSVFEIAKALMERLGTDAISTIQLQKLCFYSLGWYGYLTGKPLFSETVYAMKHGPVIGELLTAHSGEKEVSKQTIEDCILEREDDPDRTIDGYTGLLLDFIATTYGKTDAWDLVKQTHQEQCWIEAWETRAEGSKRALLEKEAVIDDFLLKAPPKDIPERVVTLMTAEELGSLDDPAQPYSPFIEAFVKKFA